MTAGSKEKWMAPLNQFVQSRIIEVTKFFREICDCQPLESMFEIDQKIRLKQPGDEIVYISVAELNLLKKVCHTCIYFVFFFRFRFFA